MDGPLHFWVAQAAAFGMLMAFLAASHIFASRERAEMRNSFVAVLNAQAEALRQNTIAVQAMVGRLAEVLERVTRMLDEIDRRDRLAAPMNQESRP